MESLLLNLKKEDKPEKPGKTKPTKSSREQPAVIYGRNGRKATGIVRRIDDLGRVVIPKEIRRTLKIREGMPMEIFTDVSGEVILKKYSPVGEMSSLAQAYAEALVSLTGQAAAGCDGEQIIALAGPAKRELLHKPISPQLEELVQNRRSFTGSGDKTIPVANGLPAGALAAFPVVSEGDPMGAVMLLKGERSPQKVSGEALESLRAASMFLSRQLEV